MDEKVIPLVDYFNSQGLKTTMSCQGHNILTQSIFWIQFDKSVAQTDIIEWMNRHLDKYGNFTSCGRFAERFYQARNGVECSYNYFAANYRAAEVDLDKWKSESIFEERIIAELLEDGESMENIRKFLKEI